MSNIRVDFIVYCGIVFYIRSVWNQSSPWYVLWLLNYTYGDATDIFIKDTWNDSAVKAAWSPRSNGYIVYAASKVEGEREAWKWVEKNKPGFVFNSILPGTNVSFFQPLTP